MSANVPEPMTPHAYDVRFHEVGAHEHAVCVYDTEDALLAALTHFVEQGIDRDELCVFVHSFASDDEAWEFLERGLPGARRLGDDQVVLVSLYLAAFEGSQRRIDFPHVTGVVDGLVHAAEQGGRAGTRIFVDASRAYFEQDRAREWFEFESRLGRRLHQQVGLVCAYREGDATRPDLFPEMLRTHAYRFDAPR